MSVEKMVILTNQTANAVLAFRADAKVEADNKMDRLFFSTLKEKVEAFRTDKKNDKQLQMAIGYMHHKIWSGKLNSEESPGIIAVGRPFFDLIVKGV